MNYPPIHLTDFTRRLFEPKHSSGMARLTHRITLPESQRFWYDFAHYNIQIHRC